MNLQIMPDLLKQIHLHGETAYPEEGAGFLLGADGEARQIISILPIENTRQGDARRKRYLIAPLDYIHAEKEADRIGLTCWVCFTPIPITLTSLPIMIENGINHGFLT